MPKLKRFLVNCISLGVLLSSTHSVLAEKQNPLEPPDTSSPRSTLEGFYGDSWTRWEFFLGPKGAVTEYLASDRLFIEPAQFKAIDDKLIYYRERLSRYLDTSEIAEEIRENLNWRLNMQLFEILTRIDLPPHDSIPDLKKVEELHLTSWVVPGTEIRIERIEKGLHKGEFLFSSDTVAKIPDYYDKVKDLPSKPGTPSGYYKFVFHTPTGLAVLTHSIIPPRWFYTLPEPLKYVVMDQPIWRWIALLLLLLIYASVFLVTLVWIRPVRYNSKGKATLWTLLPSAMLVVESPIAATIMDSVLRITPYLFIKIELILWCFYYSGLTMLVWRSGGLFADWLIHYERLKQSSLDGQVLRLVIRLMTIIFAAGILVSGANRLGIPVYSIMAGLGIGGLAAALAGQQTLANLFGSLIIMIEKPFKIGHNIRAGGFEGTVDDIGFRSTRILTSDNTYLMIPSSSLVNHTIENLSLRHFWHMKHVLYVEVSTPMPSLLAYVEEIRGFIETRSDIRKDKIKIHLTRIGLHGYEILVDFSVRAHNEGEFLAKQDKILFRLGEIAAEREIQFERPIAG